MQAVAILVPLDFVLIALMHEARLHRCRHRARRPDFCSSNPSSSPCSAARPRNLPSSAAHAHHLSAAVSLPGYALFAFAAAGIVLLVTFLFTRKPLDSALLWSLCAFFSSLRFTGTTRSFDRLLGHGGVYSCGLDHRELLSSCVSRRTHDAALASRL